MADKWRLDSLLGVGGMAAVYAATHRNGRRVAIKILKQELSRDAEARERFLAEGYVANRIGHPAAVAVLDDGNTDDGSAFLVMDLLEGETAEERWSRLGPLPVADVVALALQVLGLLAEAHDKRIVHRDIKPENLFLTRSGEVKVLDFGIAAFPDPSRTRVTQPGSMMGTPAFMPPEQARGRWEEVDGRSDLWSLGATMFALLSGRLIHDADTVNEQLLAAMTRRAPPLLEVAPHIPPAIAAVVDRALAFDRSDRFMDARVMRDALVRASGTRASAATLPATPVPLGERPPSEPVQSTAPHTLSRTMSRPSLVAAGEAGVGSRGSRSSARRSWRSAMLFAGPVLVGAAALGIGLGWLARGGSNRAGIDPPERSPAHIADSPPSTTEPPGAAVPPVSPAAGGEGTAANPAPAGVSPTARSAEDRGADRQKLQAAPPHRRERDAPSHLASGAPAHAASAVPISLPGPTPAGGPAAAGPVAASSTPPAPKIEPVSAPEPAKPARPAASADPLSRRK